MAQIAASAVVDENLQIYQQVGNDKPLSSSSRFIVVEDFNSGKFEKRSGATWRVKSPAIGALDLSIDKQDGRNTQRGYSLKANVNLQPREEASFETFLNRIDVSKAEALAFQIKLDDAAKGFSKSRLKITLRDWLHKSVTKDVTEYAATASSRWTDVAVPASLFHDEVDLDQLQSLKVGFETGEEPLLGKIWFDEIAFFSRGDIAFESQRDNFVGFPEITFDNERRRKLKAIKKDKKFLKEIARDTWKFFINARDKDTYLITDHIRVGASPLIAQYTSPTNIAMDLLAIISAMELGFIERPEALDRTRQIFQTLGKMPKYQGFFYNFYDIKKLSIERRYISSVDSGWLAISLVVVRQAFPELHEEATQYLDGFDFGKFLDPENNQLVVGLELPMEKFGDYHYGMLVTEARATSFYAIGKGDVPREHWWFLYRTLPEVWRWQTQKPQGDYATAEGVEYFQGYYEKNDKKFVPSWGGSLFEVLMPTLVLKERELAPAGLGRNNKVLTELQREYAKEKGYPIWGISPCSLASGRTSIYREYGVPELGAKGYPDREVITPHVSFLALDSLPEKAIENIRKMLDFELYGEYGFYDSFYLRKEIATPQYLSLDQGMILAALANYLRKGVIQELFHADPIARKAENLLKAEVFFNDN